MQSVVNMAFIFCGLFAIGVALEIIIFIIFKYSREKVLEKIGKASIPLICLGAIIATPMSFMNSFKTAIPERAYEIPTVLTVDSQTYDVKAQCTFKEVNAYADMPIEEPSTAANLISTLISGEDEAVDPNEVLECFILNSYTVDGLEFTGLPEFLSSSRSYQVSVKSADGSGLGTITVDRLHYDSLGIDSSERWGCFSFMSYLFYGAVIISAAFVLFYYAKTKSAAAQDEAREQALRAAQHEEEPRRDAINDMYSRYQNFYSQDYRNEYDDPYASEMDDDGAEDGKD